MSLDAFKEGLFRDRVVVVTGGGTGIGFEVAMLAGRLGAKAAICGRRETVLREAADRLTQEAIQVAHHVCDIRVPESVDAFVANTMAVFGRIDVLVNNAGGQFPTPAEHLSPKGFDAVVRNNLSGTWTMTHAVATRAMIPKKRGRIVNVIAQIVRGFPGMVHTGAARAGVDNMTKTLAVEWATHGVRVNAVAPGVIATTGTAQYPPELLEFGRRATPLKRLGTAEEVARAIVFLASDAADFITGQTLYIDGGQSLWGDLWQIPD